MKLLSEASLQMNVHLAMQKIIQLMPNGNLYSKNPTSRFNIVEFRKILLEMSTDMKDRDLLSKLHNDQHFYKFLYKIFFEELKPIKLRIWSKQKMFQSPMATHISLEMSLKDEKLYASLWPGEFVSSVEDDYNKTHHEPTGKFGETIELRSLNLNAIKRAFIKIRTENIPWNAYGSWNCAYFRYLCKVCTDVCDCRKMSRNFLQTLISLCSEKDKDDEDNDANNANEIEPLFKQRHNVLNCSGLVLVLMEHGGINNMVKLPLLSARKNKILILLKLLTFLSGTVSLICIIVQGFRGVRIEDDSSSKYLGYTLLGSGALTILSHIPYWIANIVYSCRGIGFWATPKGVKWLAEKLVNKELELKLFIEHQLKIQIPNELEDIRIDQKRPDSKKTNNNAKADNKHFDKAVITTPLLFSSLRVNDDETYPLLIEPIPKSRRCCVIL